MILYRNNDINDLPNEVWGRLNGEPFEISNLGRVKNFIRNKIVCSYPGKRGYLRVGLVKYSALVHRLVARVFIPNPENKPEVNHKDGNRQNNNVENLEWATCRENIIHAFASGIKSAKGEKNNFSKLTTEQVLEIRNNYVKGEWGFKKKYAKKFNIHPQTVKGIYMGKTWKHLNE